MIPNRSKMSQNDHKIVSASAQNAQKRALQAASRLANQVYEYSNHFLKGSWSDLK